MTLKSPEQDHGYTQQLQLHGDAGLAEVQVMSWT